MKYLMLTLSFLLFASCKEESQPVTNSLKSEISPKVAAEKNHDDCASCANCQKESFAIKPPNNGSILELGGDVAVLETVLNQETGELRVYVHSGFAKEQIIIEQKELVLKIKNAVVKLTADDKVFLDRNQMR